MAFPNTPILSTFNVADQSPAPGFAGPVTAGGSEIVIRVVSNEAAANTGVEASGWLSGQIIGPDVELYITPTTAPGDGNFVGLMYRVYDPGTTTPSYYELRARQNAPSPASNTIELVKRFQAGSTIASIGNVGVQWVQGDSFGVRCIGTSHEVWYKPAAGAWTRLTIFNDATHTAAGFVGLHLMFSASRADNFGGGDGSGSGTVIQPGMSNWWTTAMNIDAEVYADIGQASAAGPFAVLARIQNPGAATFSAYALEVTTAQMKIRRWVSGVATDLATIPTAVASGDSIGLSVVGSTLTAWRKPLGGAWTQVGAVTDTVIPTAGYVGIWSVGNNGWVVDNVGGGSLSTAAGRTLVKTGAGVSGRSTW